VALSTPELRARLLAACDKAYDKAAERRGYGSGEVRHGILTAQRAIVQAAVEDDPLRWLERVHRAVERVRAQLTDPHDDGWALGGVATIRNLVEDARDEARREAPKRALAPAEALLRLSAAARKAFPDRAEALLATAEGWFHLDGDRTCSLCARALERGGDDEIELCPRCARLREAKDVPNEAPLRDLVRAVRASGDDRAEELCAELERRYYTCEVRAVESVPCAACKRTLPGVTGRCTLCFTCVRIISSTKTGGPHLPPRG